MLTSTTLDTWTLTAATPVPVDLPAAGLSVTVPGCAHTDLMAAGLLGDPHVDLNEQATAWVAQADWTYTTTLPEVTTPHADVVFEGLDTVADVWLDDTLLGSVADMHRTWRFRVGPGPAGRRLRVAFRSKAKAAAAAALAKGLVADYPEPFNALRTMACSFGWDWGPTTMTSGIWRPVRLETWHHARLDEVRTAVGVVDGDGVLHLTATATDLDGAGRLEVVASCGGASVTATPGRMELVVPSARLWWPVGYGDQPLYDLAVELRRVDADGGPAQVLDRRTLRVGFRTVHWRTDPDTTGTPFECHVNGVRVNQRGFSWIPDDTFPHRVTPQRYRERLAQARWAHSNTVRVWGGGIFESDAFYDACDELGLMVWQDCLFACYPYDEEPATVADVEAEVHDNLTRIGHHASLVLVNGGNEVTWGSVDWWSELTDRPWGDGYFHDLLPWLVGHLTPHLTYLPNSPISTTGDAHPNSDDHLTSHLWDMWNRRDWPGYRDHRPRFAAEFGWQAPPTWTTLTAAVHDDPLTPSSPAMITHQKAFAGAMKLMRGLASHLPTPTTMRDWHWATQLNQADAVACGVEWLRSTSPHCAGQLVWQLNDCWPGVSWAAVDGAGRPKPLLHAMRHSFAPRLATVQPDHAGLPELVCVNDTPEPWRVTGRVTRHAFDGRELAHLTVAMEVPPADTGRLPLDDLGAPHDPAAELVVVEVTGAERAYAWYCEPRDSRLGAAELTVEVAATADGFEVTLTATTLVRQATLLVDQLHPDARADRALVTLLPGERATVTVTAPGATLPTEAEVRAALRTVNELVAPAR